MPNMEEEGAIEFLDRAISKIFVFSIVWAVVATVDKKCAEKFDQMSSSIFSEKDIPRGSLFESFIDFK